MKLFEIDLNQPHGGKKADFSTVESLLEKNRYINWVRAIIRQINKDNYPKYGNAELWSCQGFPTDNDIRIEGPEFDIKFDKFFIHKKGQFHEYFDKHIIVKFILKHGGKVNSEVALQFKHFVSDIIWPDPT